MFFPRFCQEKTTEIAFLLYIKEFLAFLEVKKGLHLRPLCEGYPDVVKLVDTSDLGSDAARCGGSSPSIRTSYRIKLIYGNCYPRQPWQAPRKAVCQA